MLVLAIHNVHNVQRLLDVIKLYLNVKVEDKLIVISKPSGPAAIDGVAEANKLVFKSGERLLVVGDLEDLFSLLKPEKTYFIVGGVGEFEEKLREAVKRRGTTSFIVSGQEIGFTRQELAYGEKLEVPNLPSNPPPTALASLLVYTLNKTLQGQKR